jgi:membrane protein implicated in regulation of membrane protease activity
MPALIARETDVILPSYISSDRKPNAFMETVYLVCLLVGGFFVLLSLLGGEFGHHGDLGAGGDAAGGVGHDLSHDLHADLGAGPGFVDLFSLRTLFLFLAFFGLTGTLLDWIGTGDTLTAISASIVGLLVGIGGNYTIRRIGYAHVSSDITTADLKGLTGRVLVPFSGGERGKISLIVKGSELRLPARSLDAESLESFNPGDEVVVVSRDGATVEVVKPT